MQIMGMGMVYQNIKIHETDNWSQINWHVSLNLTHPCLLNIFAKISFISCLIIQKALGKLFKKSLLLRKWMRKKFPLKQ